jgi:hypothetical protein
MQSRNTSICKSQLAVHEQRSTCAQPNLFVQTPFRVFNEHGTHEEHWLFICLRANFASCFYLQNKLGAMYNAVRLGIHHDGLVQKHTAIFDCPSSSEVCIARRTSRGWLVKSACNSMPESMVSIRDKTTWRYHVMLHDMHSVTVGDNRVLWTWCQQDSLVAWRRGAAERHKVVVT